MLESTSKVRIRAISLERLFGFASKLGFVLSLSLFLTHSCFPLELNNPNDPGSRSFVELQVIDCILKNPACSAGSTGSGSGTNAAMAPTFSYSGSPYTLTQNLLISTISPVVTGTITQCSSNPSLPSGLVLANETCAISGTPTVNQSATAYDITASNTIGSTKATINITISAAAYSIGGTLTGLTAPGLVLQNNAGNDLTVSSGASTFTFSADIASGANYAVPACLTTLSPMAFTFVVSQDRKLLTKCILIFIFQSKYVRAFGSAVN